MPKLNRHLTLWPVAPLARSRGNYNCIRQVIAMAMFGRKIGINYARQRALFKTYLQTV